MGRKEKPVDPAAGPVQLFAFELRKLRSEAGAIAYRVLAERSGYSITALSQAAAGEKLPSLALTLGYVRACAGDERRWEQRWHDVTREESETAAAHEDAAAAPYRGLTRFEPGDEEFFFGRDRVTAELVELAGRHRLTMVFGPSGCGKSSLLRAGLIPCLRRFTDPRVRPAALRILTPGPHPLRTAMQVLAPADADGDTWLIVDQFEEIFTLCHDTGERKEFIGALVAAQDPASRLRIVLGVRADFYPHCLAHPELASVIRESSVAVGPLGGVELRAAIVKPAQAHGLTVERALSDRLVEEVAGEPGSLPLLSHALLETWRRRRGSTLTVEAYEAAGGIQGSLAQTAEALYARLSLVQARQTQRILLRLITPGEGTPDTRRPESRAALHTTDPETTDIVLERMARARLITVDDTTVDLAHEALITSWPRLRGWIDEAREQLRTHRRLTEAARAWDDLGRDPGALYRGTRLAAAEEAFAAPHTAKDLNCLERDFLIGSTTARDAEHRTAARATRRLRRLTSTLAVLLVVAVVASLIAWNQYGASEQRRNQAIAAQQTALSRQLAAQSAALLADAPDLASLLAVQAYRTHPTVEATAGLHTAAANPTRHLLTGPTAPVGVVTFSPDGRTVAAASSDGKVRMWDAANGAVRKVFPAFANGVTAVSFSPDGRLLAAGVTDGTLRLRNVLAGGKAWTATGRSKGLGQVTFSPDGRTVAAASSDGKVRMWDATTGAARKVFATSTDGVTAVAFSPDGRFLAVGDTAGAIRVHDLVRGATRVVRPTGLGPFTTMAFSPDSRLLAAGGTAGPTVVLSDLVKGGFRTRSTGHTGSVQAVVFSPDGYTVATASDDRTVRVWDASTGRNHAVLTGHADFMSSVAFSPDGRTLASGSRDRTVRLWDLAQQMPDRTQAGSTTISSMAFTDDGRALGTGYVDGKVQIWDALGPRPRSARPVGDVVVTSVVPSTDGHLKAASISSDGHTVRVWDATDRRIRAVVRHGPRSDTVLATALSNDERTLATGAADGTVRLWDVASSRNRAVLNATDVVSSLAFSRDGITLVSAGGDGKVRLWDTATGRSRTIITDMATSVALTPDSRTLATGHSDGTVRLWDLPTRTVRTTLSGSQRPVSALAISPNQRTLAASSVDGTIQRWKLRLPDPAQAIDMICRALHRDFTQQERSQYLRGQPQRQVCPRTRAGT